MPEPAWHYSAGRDSRSFLVQRLISTPFLGLLLLGATLAAGPVLAKITGVPDLTAAVSPAISSFNATKSGCTPINPCAMVTPALGSVTMPVPEMAAQPDLPTSTAAAAAPAGAAPARAANPNCPPAGARRGFARSQNGGAGRGQQFAKNGRGGGGQGRGQGRDEGRGQGFARDGGARGGDGCPRPAGAGQGRTTANTQPAGR
jgi:hypothetical protein